ncbi:MAG: DNA double-strand break repair nuclease NurA, partial [Candidatus Hodarchaeales archaeon]
SKSNISLASKTVNKALPNLIGIYAIVKRTGSSAVLNRMKQQLESSPNKALRQILENKYFNDTSFFARYLKEGNRSLFYEDRSTNEENANLPDELTRVCCYLKMDNRKVVRLEMPKKVAYEHGDLTMANDIANMVYWQAKESSKPLPNYFHLADETAKLTRTKIEGYKTPIDEFLKSIGDSTIEFNEWKGYT